MPAGVDEIYRSIKFDLDGADFSKWPKLSCSAANELTLATPPTQDDANPGVARLAIAGELKLQAGVGVNELSSDEKLTNNSDLAIPTQKAVKTYVDNQIAVVNQSLSTKAALTGAASQDFESKNLSVSGNLTANGNVSIGATSSSYKLAIAAGDINIDDGRALRQAGRWVIGGDSNVLSLGSSNAPDGRDIRFDPGFSGALTIKKDTGNVGIGTANPETKLEVKGNLTLDRGGSPVLYTGTGNSELNRYLELLNSHNFRSASGLRAGGILVSDSYAYANPSKNDLIVKGNVGIGTANPVTKLEVKGDLTVDKGGNPVLYTGTGNSELNRYLELLNSHNFRSASGLRAGGILVSDSYAYANPSKNDLIVKGNVGIGTANPAYKLDVAGQVHASNFPTSSDVRLKTNVTPLTNVLDKLEKISGISFEWNELYESLGRSTGHREIGVTAQEVEAVFPELVTTWGDEDYKAVDYGRLAGVLIEAVKELKAENEALTQELKAEKEDWKQRIEALERAKEKK